MVTCLIWFDNCLQKDVKGNNIKTIIDVKHFKTFTKRWDNYDQVYNKVFSLVVWGSSEKKTAHKTSKGEFFVES